jgi:hypothetical protein
LIASAERGQPSKYFESLASRNSKKQTMSSKQPWKKYFLNTRPGTKSAATRKQCVLSTQGMSRGQVVS